MRRVLFVAAILASCSKPQIDGAGLQATVVVDSDVKADCIAVVATSSGDSAEHTSGLAPRAAQLTFPVVEGHGLTGTIRLVARGYLGDCSQTPSLNAESAARSITFVEGRTDGTVNLELAGALDDSDHDGFRAADAGGTDCDDSSAAVNPGATEACSDGIDNNCNGKIDCADSPACDGTVCNDGQDCSTDDRCRGGVCMGLSAQCNAPPGGCFHLPGQCLGDGGCTYAVDAGAPCDAGICASNGACVPPGTEVLCSDHIDNDGDGKTDCFDPDCWGQSCSDSNLCTDNDVCQTDGTCAGTARVCGAAIGPCFDAGTCVSASGNCVYPVARGTCDDGNPCTTNDVCGADAGCAGAPRGCNTPTNSCFVRQGVCDVDSGSCVYTPDAGAPCNDLDPCTFTDRCSNAGSCVGTSYNCNAPPACYGAGACQGDGGCTYSQVNGAACNGGQGVCLSGTCQTIQAFGYVPSNFGVPDGGWSAPVQLMGTCAAVFDSTAGQFTSTCGLMLPAAQQVMLADGKQAQLLLFSQLTVGPQAKLTLRGDLPVILAVAGDAAIEGLIDASSGPMAKGAGGGYSGCGPGANGNGAVGVSGGSGRGSGAGGGAFGSTGSPGAGVPSAGGGAGGVVNGGGVLVPLRGGCNGQQGGNMNGGVGGIGGGGVQLSVAGNLTLSGIMAAGGEGGQAGQDKSSGGGGAGSGGGVLLEADTLIITSAGLVLTNGGGGGEGAPQNGAGQSGASGSATSATAAPGGAASSSGGDGANGAAGLTNLAAFTAAGGTTAAMPGSEGGGGGGGGVGQIVLRGISTCFNQGTLSGRATSQGVCP